MTVQPIGGEMLQFTDSDPAGGPSLRPLLGAVTGRTLVAGPHDPALIDALPAEQITVLVRGVADAEALGERYANRPGVTVCCGSLEKLAAVPSYDSVLALDGLGRLCTPEAPDLTWDETLGQLLAVLRPHGRLLLGLDNRFGLDRLVALPPAPADSDWTVPDDHPTGPAALHARLAAAGLPVVREYAAYGTALLGAEVLIDPALRGYLEATLTGLFRPRADLLADPARLLVGALRHGLAADLAPAWILLAGDLPAGPAALVGGSSLRRDATNHWVREDGAPVPAGRTLSDLLVAASERRAQPVVRELLTAWQAGPAAGVPAAQIVVDAAGGHHALAPAGTPVGALREFARSVIDTGLTHLWPAPADEASLTALLAGMTGRELSPEQVPAAARPSAGTVRELTIARERLERELAEARAKHEFYERQIASRDAELKRVRQLNAVLSATVPGKAATTLVGGLKAGRRAVRAVVRRTRD